MSAAPLTKTTLRAEGFSCPSCVDKIEKSVGRMRGVDQVKVHFASARIEVEHDAGAAPVDTIVQAIRATGYEARPAAF